MYRCSRADLVAQGFSGAVEAETVLEYVGTVSGPGWRFDIVYYDFANPRSDHGNYRVLVMGDHCKYLGSYTVTERPKAIEANRILFDLPDDYGNVITFENGQIPKRVWVDGKVHEFWR